MNFFIYLILALMIPFSVLIYLLRKKVYDSVISVAVDATEYPKGATVGISGSLLTSTGTPEPSETVNYSIQDPDGTVYGPFVAVTDENGLYSASWTVPTGAPTGDYTLTATAKGATAITTFMLSKFIIL